MGLFGYVWHTFFRRTKLVNILNYVDYHKDNAKELISKELGWVDYGYKHFESIFTRFFQGYILPEKFNMDKRLPHFSSLILSGQMRREEAIELLKQKVYPENLLQEDMEFLLKKWGLSKEEFEKNMKQPPRTYKEYGDMSWLFDNTKFLFKIIRKFILSV
jgi:hypothetical protein